MSDPAGGGPITHDPGAALRHAVANMDAQLDRDLAESALARKHREQPPTKRPAVAPDASAAAPPAAGDEPAAAPPRRAGAMDVITAIVPGRWLALATTLAAATACGVLFSMGGHAPPAGTQPVAAEVAVAGTPRRAADAASAAAAAQGPASSATPPAAPAVPAAPPAGAGAACSDAQVALGLCS